jgi:hypothetical protein
MSGGGGDDVYHIINVFRNKQAKRKICKFKFFCLNENLSYEKKFNFMNVMELKI